MNSYFYDPKYDFPEELVSRSEEYTFKFKKMDQDGNAVYDMIDNKTGKPVGSELHFKDNTRLKAMAYHVKKIDESNKMKDLKKIQEFFSKPLEEATFKVGNKVTYLGHPGVITAVRKTPSGDTTYSVAYDKGFGRTKVSDIFNKGGEIKLAEAKSEDKVDTITMDIPLFLRMLEYSREDASQDMDLHDVTEKANALGKEKDILTMDDYDAIVGAKKVDEAKLSEAYVPSNIKEFAKRKGVSSLVNKVAGWAERVGARITGGTAIGKNYDTLILDMGYQTADIYINTEDGTIELYGEPADSFPQFKEAFMNKVTRDEIEKDKDQFRREQGLEETLVKKVMERLRKS